MQTPVISRGEAANAPNILVSTGALNRLAEYTELHFADGRVIRVPTSVLDTDSGLDSGTRRDARASVAGDPLQDEATVIPVVEEQLSIEKRTVATGAVNLHKTVQSYQTALDEPLAIRTYDIERVVLNQPVETAPGVRQEDDVTIYPVVEEQAIITKQLILREEIRVTRRDTERRDQRQITLRREHVEIERIPAKQSLNET